MNDIRLVLIEDHDLSRIGLSAALQQIDGIQIVGSAATARQGLQAIETLQPDVAIVDIGLPDMDGIELTQSIKQRRAEAATTAKVLILTMHGDEDAVMAAFAAGADSYALKDVDLENLVQAIHATHEGNAWIDPAIARVVLKHAKGLEKQQEVKGDRPKHTPADTGSANEQTPHQTVEIDSIEPEEQQMLEISSLTERELDVLELIVAGCSNAIISERLHITVGTVKTHVRSILGKLCAEDRTQAAVRALRSGLVR